MDSVVLEFLENEIEALKWDKEREVELISSLEERIISLDKNINKISYDIMLFSNVKDRYLFNTSNYSNDVVNGKIRDLELLKFEKTKEKEELESRLKRERDGYRFLATKLSQLEELLNKISSNKA